MRSATLRATLVAAVLALTILLAALLTIRAISAERYHRRTAEQVLVDYASLGAEGVAARLRNAFTARLYPVLTAAAAAPGVSQSTLATVRGSMAGVAGETAGSVGALLRVDTASGTLATTGRALTDDDLRAIRATVRTSARALPAAAYFGMEWLQSSAGTELVVFQPYRANPPRSDFTVLTLPESVVVAFVARAVTNGPVLPASLSHGAKVDSGLMVRVMSAGSELFVHGSIADTAFRARRPLGPGFGDLVVEVKIAESIAPALISFGLPRSSVPLLVAVLTLIVLMVLAVADQLRRERQLLRLRDEFVASASHELRTPLAQIRLFAETLRLARVRSPEEGERSLAIIENEAKRLEHLVGNLLHFSRAEHGAIGANIEPVDLSALVGEIASEFSPLAERGGSSVRTAVQPGIQVNVDPGAVRQMILNLLDNAVKYGRKGQVISLSMSVHDAAVRIVVADEGEGIPPGERRRVFERFWRGDVARRAGVTGTGIGLAIVGDVARMHAGSVSVGQSPKGGAEFTVELPMVGA